MKTLFFIFLILTSRYLFAQPTNEAFTNKDTSLQAYIEYKFIDSFRTGYFKGFSSYNNDCLVKLKILENVLTQISFNSETPLKIELFLIQTIKEYFATRQTKALSRGYSSAVIAIPVSYYINVVQSSDNQKSEKFLQKKSSGTVPIDDSIILLERVLLIQPFDSKYFPRRRPIAI